MDRRPTDMLRNELLETDLAERYTIMVVDDDESLQLYMKTILEHYYDIVQATTAEEALDHLRKRNVDVILLDLMMPGIPGMSLLARLKEEWKEKTIPVIVLTARTDMQTKVQALESGADDYITKPFKQQELLTRIKVQLRVRILQHQSIRSERLKAIIETAISANHEINNPLCAVINNAELLMAHPVTKGDPEIRGRLEQILANAQRIEKTLQTLANMIQPMVTEYLPGVSMLDLSRSKSSPPEGAAP
jgi:CheY-like chemotaxis protein